MPALAALATFAAAASADDTEVFVARDPGGARPNVLLVIDTSGSMRSLVQVPKAPYDPTRRYDGACRADRIYWRRGPGAPPACTARQFIEQAANTCAAALQGLRQVAGLWTGRLAQWQAEAAQWRALRPDDEAAPVECAADSGRHGADAGSPARWARNGAAGSPWTADAAAQLSWASAEVHTLYSANWLNWHHGPAEPATLTRLEAVQAAATALAYSIDGVNFGLMRFSHNGGPGDAAAEGGMVIHPIENVATARDSLAERIRALQVGGFTPLAETLYEAGRYLAGGPLVYGRDSRIDPATPLPSVPESRRPDDPAHYRSPIEHACQRSHVVLLTDGEPSHDNGADARIESLPGFGSLVGRCEGEGPGRCLAAMAAYLYRADLSALPGQQNAITHAIGFGPEVAGSARLAEAARGGVRRGVSFLETRGGKENPPKCEFVCDLGGSGAARLAEAPRAGAGSVFSADDIGGLTDALQRIVGGVLQSGATFTTAAVAVDAFNRTQSLNDLYVTMFRPTQSLRWPGNLKKYALRGGRIVDADGRDAVDESTGFLARAARSVWSAAPDGDRVEQGGMVSRLPAPVQRHLYTYLASAGTRALTAPINRLDVDNAALTAERLGIGSAGPSREELIRWVRGLDVRDIDGDGDTDEPHRSVGDPLHARPAVVSYGGTAANPDAADAVVFVPTNDGFLHVVDARSGRELWAFVPPELLGRLPELYHDPPVGSRSYGLDGDVRVLRFDADGNGVIERGAGDRVWLYFGMRRGGRFYYALDVTERSEPRLQWTLGPDALPGLGESWSTPGLARVRVSGAAQNGEHLVLIFGGGYDEAQEHYAYATDTSAHRIFMVDAMSGGLLWYAGGPGGAGVPDLLLPRMRHSIPGRVVALDTDGDRFADRLYAADLGGQVWRFDVWNGRSRSELVTGGLFADLGAAAEPRPSIENTRRFYYAPDVALIQRRGVEPYFNLALGSGYRGHPLHRGTHDRFYALRDPNPFGRLTQAEYGALRPITEADLADITEDIAAGAVPAQARGWKLELRLPGGWAGEKVLAESVTVDGAVMFTTYQPLAPDAADPCRPAGGRNRLYALRVDGGRPAIDRDADLQISAADAWTELAQSGIAGEASVLLERTTGASGAAGDGRTGSAGDDGQGVDALGRRALCLVGVEVLRNCIAPGSVVRTFWRKANTE